MSDDASDPARSAASATGAPAAGGGLVGRVVNGKYDVQAVVASGGMGKIYRAEQQPLGRTVALKVLHARAGASLVSTGGATPGTGGDSLFKKRFFREASILARLQHPNIVTVFDYGKIDGLPADDDQFFMAMEYLSGETLQQRITARGPLPVDDVLKIARQVGRGLREAHANGMVHRDLKPSNLMIVTGRDGEDLVKILDFGIVKLTAEDDKTQELTQEGLFIGSPKYMAPEQISNGTIDVRTDIYSLGVILYQCLTAKVPFEADTSIQIMMAHLNQVAVPLREKAPDVPTPEWLEALVMSCLEKDADKRPPTIEELLRRMAEGAGLGSHPSVDVHPESMARAVVGGPYLSGAMRGATSLPRSAAARSQAPSHGAPMRAADDGATETRAAASLASDARELDGRTSDGLGRRNTVILACVAAAAIATIGLAASVRARSRPVEASPSMSTDPAQVVASRRTFTISIESLPPGADVEEDGTSVGTTPLRLALDNDSVGRSARHFVVKRAGYQPFAIVQGASSADARVVATLLPTSASAAPTTSTARVAPAAAADASAGHATVLRKAAASADKPHAPSPPPSDLDIRLTR